MVKHRDGSQYVFSEKEGAIFEEQPSLEWRNDPNKPIINEWVGRGIKDYEDITFNSMVKKKPEITVKRSKKVQEKKLGCL